MSHTDHTARTPNPNLPLDILHSIVDHTSMANDLATLKVLARTTSLLTRQCQQRLFKEAVIGAEFSSNNWQCPVLTRLTQALESKPHLAGFVKSLEIRVLKVERGSGIFDFDGSVYEIVRKLTSLERLWLWTVPGTWVHSTILQTIESPCLSTLGLNGCLLQAGSLSPTTFSNVHTLVIHGAAFAVTQPEGSSKPAFVFQPVVVDYYPEVDGEGTYYSLENLHDELLSVERLRSLSVNSSVVKDLRPLSSLISQAASTLESLTVKLVPENFGPAANVLHPENSGLFEALTSLRTFGIRVQASDCSDDLAFRPTPGTPLPASHLERAMNNAITASASPNLQTIEFHIVQQYSPHLFASLKADWRRLDGFIRDGKYGRVKRFRIVCHLSKYWKEQEPEYSYEGLSAEMGGQAKEWFVYANEKGVEVVVDHDFE